MLIIHVVSRGESVYLISRYYSISPDKIISDNGLANPNQLAVGQTLVIMDSPSRHTVAAGESLYSIAFSHGLSLAHLLQANPQLTVNSVIYPGQVLTIPPRTMKLGTMEVNGYAMPGTDLGVLYRTFPYLTYLSIFSYSVNPDGSLNTIDDTAAINAARQSGVAPVMVITNRGFNSDVASVVLYNAQAQERLLSNIMRTLRTKNYYSLNIDFEYVYPSDRQKYNDFLSKAVNVMGSAGYRVSTALAPKLSAGQSGLQYYAHDYASHGALADRVIIMTYEWGFTYGPPMAVAPLNEVQRVLDYTVTAIPRRKVLMGIPNYGYDWTLPYVQGTAARVVSNTGAVQLAYAMGADIKYDPVSQAPYFNYYDDSGRPHVVWFEDARSIYAKLQLPARYGLAGVSYWTIGRFFPQNWLVLHALYDTAKVL
jgi:spore germination protein